MTATPAQVSPPLHRQRLVVVGNGMAALRTVEEILALAPDRFHITVLGAEPHGNYNRILLSSVLAGDKQVGDIVTHPPGWYAERGIALRTGDPVVSIDPEHRRVSTASGHVVAWDRLLLATGARPLMPALPGAGLEGVYGFRTIGDVQAMLASAGRHRRAVVVGGGVLGLEAAWGLRRQGMAVTVIHLTPWLMERQLDEVAAAMLRHDLERHGIACLTSAQAARLEGRERVEAVTLSDGRTIAADLVVMAVGIRPNTDLARQAGLEVGRGITVDARMRSSAPDIFAVGECVEHDGQCYGLVMPLWDMARVCAHHLTGGEGERLFTPPSLSTRLKIPGIALFSAGEPAAANDDDRELIHHDPGQSIYKKLVLRRGRLVGAVLYGDVEDSARVWQWLCDGDDVGHLCAGNLCLGRISGQCAAADPLENLPDDAVVCHCNGVTKGAIVAAIAEHGLTSLEQVTARTRACSGCGQCAALTARILARTLGEDGAEALAAETRRSEIRAGAFRLWHRANAVLMSVLAVTGLFLHFAGTPAALLRLEWAFGLHKWSGLTLVAAYGAFLGLTALFRRRWRANAEGMVMFVLMPALVVTGLAFLWPVLLPQEPQKVNGIAWVAVVHTVLAIALLMYLIHHLGTAPVQWWRKRKARAFGG
ncbi:FAD-dependent oxidoreductase [Paramagnetospirillum magneticum]|uniref:NAD(P)H-nitrite reductase n=1 Tax=Paramagnetospirillum magneticum (strain ATCC 700264 / AMB-1) TaxID=342108 RepID=Q2W2V7_PARM1|nr:FAD-dependent oxidoreductase [Paramagnetospirillum magneticum]BAE51818.1 NAD(P)H-nitrite reductase [Paramagnetospirillum magneticum AMB-1]